MACKYSDVEPVVLRRSFPVNDPAYVGYDEHVTELHLRDRQALCKKICLDGDHCDKTLASLAHSLGITDKELSSLSTTSDKIFQLIHLWSKKEGSTVKILIEAMKDMDRQDCVKFIEQSRKKSVKLHLRLHYNSNDSVDLSGSFSDVPERRSFKSVVEPVIQDRLAFRFPYNRKKEFRLFLKRLGGGTWDTQVKHYAGQQVHLYLKEEKTTNNQRCNTSPAVMDDWRRFGRCDPMRKAHTEYSSNLSFDYTDQDVNDFYTKIKTSSDLYTKLTTTSTTGASSTVWYDKKETKDPVPAGIISLHEDYESAVYRPDPRERLSGESPDALESEILFSLDFRSTERLTSDVHEQDKSIPSTGTLSRKPARPNTLPKSPPKPPSKPPPKSPAKPPSSGLPSNLTPSNMETRVIPQRDDEEWSVVSQLPGFRSYNGVDERELSEKATKDIEEYCLNHKKDGCYIIRPSQNSEHRFALTLKCKKRVYHFTISKDPLNGKYELHNIHKRTFDSVRSLIEYFTNNYIHVIGKVKLSVPIQNL